MMRLFLLWPAFLGFMACFGVAAEFETVPDPGRNRIYFAPRISAERKDRSLMIQVDKIRATLSPNGNLKIEIDCAIGNGLTENIFLGKLSQQRVLIHDVRVLRGKEVLAKGLASASGGARSNDFILLAGRKIAGERLYRDDAIIFSSYRFGALIDRTVFDWLEKGVPLQVEFRVSFDCAVLIVGEAKLRTEAVEIPLSAKLERLQSSQ